MRSAVVLLIALTGIAAAQDAPSPGSAPIVRREAPAIVEAGPAPPATAPAAALPASASPVTTSHFDAAMFHNPIAPARLTGLEQAAGAPTSDLMHDKEFRKALKAIVPDCMFHYGRDMPLNEALDAAIKDSRIPVQVRDGRYLLVAGAGGQYLSGRGFVWVDLKTGEGLGGFYFHPTNGEPTPSLAVFSRQVKEDALASSDLPPAFLQDLAVWTEAARVPPLTTRYFITGANRRVLLEHDEDYCSPTDGTIADGQCQEEIASAADVDLNAAYYLEAVNYRTNATAWMISPEETAWFGVRDRQCGGIVDPLGCRIRLTRERVHVIVRRGLVGKRG